MCIAAPGRIKAIKGREVEVEYPGVGVRQAMVGVEGLKRGDWVMVQMGVVMQRLSRKQAEELEGEWKSRT